MKRVVIIGCGFTGINAAKVLGNKDGFEVTLIDRSNYHLFQPLLYQKKALVEALRACDYCSTSYKRHLACYRRAAKTGGKNAKNCMIL